MSDQKPASSQEAGNGGLKRKRSVRNDGAINGESDIDIRGSTINSDDGDWKDYTGGPRRRMRRKDIVWPDCASQSTKCCVTCNAMMGTVEGLYELLHPRGYKHLSWYELQVTASQGCALCQSIWEVTEHADWDYNEENGWVVRDEIRITGSFTQLMEDAKSLIEAQEGHIPKGHPLEGRLLNEIEVHIPLDRRLARPLYEEGEVWHLVAFDANPASRVISGRRECKDLTSKAAAEIVQWLNECQDKHSSCPRRRHHALPRRVIDLGSRTLRLRQSDPDEKAPYAALSYCWGGVAQLTTMAANLNDHLQAIDVASLPKTIRDAVEVCRAIGMRYLWVDALCIVQDDNNDKLDQIASMGLIYKNSTVTIVAASAEKVTDGFLGNAKPEGPHIQLPLYVDDTTTGTVYLRIKDGTQTYSAEEPIFQRGWTYQELLLSPRCVIFDASQIMLKCLTDNFRPLFQTYVDVQVDAPELPPGVFGMADENLAGRSSRESRERYFKNTQDRIWKAVVHDYSERDMSCFSDRLPALAGIATELAAVWDDVYLAGFWERTILQHLAWYRTQRKYRCNGIGAIQQKDLFDGVVDVSRHTGGPTWSWATAPYPVTIDDLDKPDPQLLGSHVQLVSPRSPFGQVRSASIVLEAKALNAAAALGPAIKFQTEYTISHHDGILLDFEEHKPAIERCRLVYLGCHSSRKMFLVVEPTGVGEYRRVGFAGFKDLPSLDAARREVVIIQ
ncbi:heterokaryon incompatibility protein-domain-containing protein [Dactylonectria macrodidyma]|uniref:Heterokaryon incompatibility protein-domain-containing protein n=1 Tax=Dactylonectria macrodidyma TaxID=307937 RepID=A0A9P9ENG3_9HYPO|nr:heterokaryon incompatibility protein-domain-containing protein [Dactylonectria macrodidyma]